jgi:hypothetical protein
VSPKVAMKKKKEKRKSKGGRGGFVPKAGCLGAPERPES